MGAGLGAQLVEDQVQVGVHGGVDRQLGGDTAKPGWPVLLVVVGGSWGRLSARPSMRKATSASKMDRATS